MATYEIGAIVERRYPGPNAEEARAAAASQIAAFVQSGFTIASETWQDDSDSGAPIGDALATGTISYLAGRGGQLVIRYQATRPAELPEVLPAYTMEDPRQRSLQTWSQLQLLVGVIFLLIFAFFFISIVSQMPGSSPFQP
jgi:hypothetical protein